MFDDRRRSRTDFVVPRRHINSISSTSSGQSHRDTSTGVLHCRRNINTVVMRRRCDIGGAVMRCWSDISTGVIRRRGGICTAANDP